MSFLATGFILTMLVGAEAESPSVGEIVESLDRLFRSDDSYTEMTMEVVTENWERTMSMEAWSLGTEKTFIRILSPARDAGLATLRIDDEMWNYLPNTGSTVRVPPSMMSGSWMGSDLTNNDIVREITYAEDYTSSFTVDSDITGPQQPEEVYILLEPRSSTAVTWSYIVCAVDESTVLPVWEKYYDSRDELIRTISYSDVRDMDDRTIPTVMRIESADEEGYTAVTWTSARFDRGVDEGIFTLGNLQSSGGW